MFSILNRITVYCASSSQIDKKYFDHAEQFAKILVDNDIELVYGGGSVGLMGCLADTILRNKGRIKGIIPDFMKQLEWAHPEVDNMHVVLDMHERKQAFFVDVDAVVALPGGCGTFEEVLEAITWKQLNIFQKPIIILNTDGYYDPLKLMLERAIAEGFIKKEHEEIWKIVDTPDEILPAIMEMEPSEIILQNRKKL